MHTGGSSVTQKFRSVRNWNILIASFLPLRVLQQDTEPFTEMIYAVWMLHIADFSDQWWGLLAIWTGHYHGMKFSTSGMSAFGPSPHRPHPNHGRKFVGDTIGIWHCISRHYLGIVGSRGLWLGNHRAADALAAQNIAGIVRSKGQRSGLHAIGANKSALYECYK